MDGGADDLPGACGLDAGARTGRSISPVTVEYETYGSLSPRKDNVVFIAHALSGDAHVAAGTAGPPRPAAPGDRRSLAGGTPSWVRARPSTQPTVRHLPQCAGRMLWHHWAVISRSRDGQALRFALSHGHGGRLVNLPCVFWMRSASSACSGSGRLARRSAGAGDGARAP